ncbi:hypothetical protein AB1462_32375, partial [Pseudomonas sp. SB113]|uniref:hypothetical protein n=1 Tax=Pseudomonas sp. SB113 TaxID=3154123 RepID=UPI00345DBB55
VWVEEIISEIAACANAAHSATHVKPLSTFNRDDTKQRHAGNSMEGFRIVANDSGKDGIARSNKGPN